MEAYDSSVITMSGGTVGYVGILGLLASDTSTVTISGGELDILFARGDSTITMSGGTVGSLWASGSSSVTMSGGTLVWGQLGAEDSSTITIVGSDFEVDGLLVPYGDLIALEGTLTGTLASGDPFNNFFWQGGGDYTGTITVTTPPAVCGNGLVEVTEPCDDGNTTPGDGCDGNCQIEPFWGCVGEPSICRIIVTCLDNYSCIINNGLTPPSSDNVIDDVTYDDTRVYVRNVGCPPDWGQPGIYFWDPCPSPGAPTEAELAGGGTVLILYALDSSTATMTGGAVGASLVAWHSSTVMMGGGTAARDLTARDSSTVTITGGEVVQWLEALDSSTVTMSGGAVGSMWAGNSSIITVNGGIVGDLVASDSSTITLVGRDFAVDGVPVSYGDLSAQTGMLAGTLAAGDPFNNVFYQGGVWCEIDGYQYSCSGTITLVEAPQLTTLSPWSQLALTAGLLGAGLGVWRGRRV